MSVISCNSGSLADLDGDKARSSTAASNGRPKQLRVSVLACPAFKPIKPSSFKQIELTVFQGPIGSGTFGSVYRGRLRETNEPVAIKRVLQDPRYKNRELSTLYSLGEHENLVRLRYHYFCHGNRQPGEIYLHLVTEIFPESLLELLLRHKKAGMLPSMQRVKIFAYQLLRAINYMHSHRISHRDIKSPNILVDESDCRLRLCDLGSAKELPLPGESAAKGSDGGAGGGGGVAYISSRYYRAPELLFGCTSYTCAIDLWSAGCVLAELCIGNCLFMANNSLDQLVAIIRVLGTPSKRDLRAMNPVYERYTYPQVAPLPQLSFPAGTPPELLDLLCRLLTYQPAGRLPPLRALAHPFFDELRLKWSSSGLPPLFNFSQQELAGADADLVKSLLPSGVADPIKANKEDSS